MQENPRYPMWTVEKNKLRRFRNWQKTKEAYQIQDFAIHDQDVQAVHDLLDRGMAIPPVNVKDVNIRCLQILETRINGQVHRFH